MVSVPTPLAALGMSLASSRGGVQVMDVAPVSADTTPEWVPQAYVIRCV